MAQVEERIGIFGGTFDPVHIGHLVAAVNARHDLGLDRVLMMVANDPWQKSGERAITPARDRLALVEAAVEGVEGIEASALEIERGGTTYTADTIAELRASHPHAQLYLIVGTDLVSELSTWHRTDEVADQVILAVVTRPGTTVVPEALEGWHARTVAVPALEISSSDLRARAASGRPLDFLVPAGAIHRIRDLALYAIGR
jgi:nicotinate-nucleotide adenylyltransferase